MTIVIIFILYIGMMLGIGMFFYNKNDSISDYILGGRSLNVWVASISAQASDMSGWLLTGLPGLAFISAIGTQEAIWTAIGLMIGTFLNWVLVAKRLRKYTEVSGNSLTMPDYFENRFKDTSRTLRIISSVFILVFFLIYTSSAFVTSAKLFQTVFGLDYNIGLILGVVIVILYTCTGGFKAVCWTDLFQGILMFIAIIIIPIVAMNTLGGYSSTMETVNTINPGLFDIFPNGENISFFTILTGLGWGLGYFGQPHILVRFMAMRSPKDVLPATTIAMIWVIISLSAAIMVGIVGVAYFNQTPLPGGSETIFMELTQQLFNPVISGILLSAVLAATMSTCDSQLIVTSSAISEDVYKAFINTEATDAQLLKISRLTVVVVSILAAVIAFDPESSIFGLVSYAWAGFGATFGPTIVMSLYWKRMTRKGAIAGVITGGVVVISWMLLKQFGGIFQIYEIVPGFIASIIAIVIASKADKEVPPEMIAEFEQVENM